MQQVQFLGASPVFSGTVGNGAPFTVDYALPAATNAPDDRYVLLEILNTTGVSVPLTISYGGDDVSESVTTYSTYNGSGSAAGKWGVTLAAFVPAQHDFEGTTLVVSTPQASTAKISVRFVVFQGVDANSIETVGSPAISIPVVSLDTEVDTTAGGMLYVICAAATAPVADTTLTTFPEITTSDGIAVVRSGFAAELAEGTQTVTWSFPSSLAGALAVSMQPTLTQSFNCDCEASSPYDTLLNVRRKMLIRLGYPNQLTNPPPGMATLVDQFLRDAQDEIYIQLQRASLRTQRFFKWTMVPGQRYYNLSEEELACTALNTEKITWVGFEDLNQEWYRLDAGIPPEYYTRANINFGWPTCYEIRSCIEIFPAPQAAYTLWIKGDFGVAPLVADDDRFTIDDKMVFLLALGNAKAHYGQKDAQLVLTQAGNYTKSIVAGAHGTKRYVPRGETPNPWTPPKFLPLGNEPS